MSSIGGIDDAIWQQAKLFYIGLLINHKQPELAETFFNSVFCRMLHRTYFHNDFIFVRPAISTEYIESDPPTYRCYYPKRSRFSRGRASDVSRFRLEPAIRRPGSRRRLHRSHGIDGTSAIGRKREANLQIQVLHSAFYRNKGAYVIGKAGQWR